MALRSSGLRARDERRRSAGQLQHADLVQEAGLAQLDQPVRRRLHVVPDGKRENRGVDRVGDHVAVPVRAHVQETEEDVPVLVDHLDGFLDPLRDLGEIEEVLQGELRKKPFREGGERPRGTSARLPPARSAGCPRQRSGAPRSCCRPPPGGQARPWHCRPWPPPCTATSAAASPAPASPASQG